MKAGRHLMLAAVGAFAIAGIFILWSGETASSAGGMIQVQDRLHECQTSCREQFGGDEWNPPPVSEGSQIAYFNCIQRCERRFWKDFDKDTEELEKIKP